MAIREGADYFMVVVFVIVQWSFFLIRFAWACLNTIIHSLATFLRAQCLRKIQSRLACNLVSKSKSKTQRSTVDCLPADSTVSTLAGVFFSTQNQNQNLCLVLRFTFHIAYESLEFLDSSILHPPHSPSTINHAINHRCSILSTRTPMPYLPRSEETVPDVEAGVEENYCYPTRPCCCLDHDLY